jgi:hypothetical protein
LRGLNWPHHCDVACLGELCSHGFVLDGQLPDGFFVEVDGLVEVCDLLA